MISVDVPLQIVADENGDIEFCRMVSTLRDQRLALLREHCPNLPQSILLEFEHLEECSERLMDALLIPLQGAYGVGTHESI
jgi:hypothetical protein